MPDEVPYSFADAQQIGQKGKLPYAGYEDQQRAGFVLAHRYSQLQRSFNILLFGTPGNGKSRFPQVLAHHLVESGLDYCLLWIQCGKVASQYTPEVAHAQLEEARCRFIRTVSEPMLVVLDEFDAIAMDRADSPAGATVCHWTLDLLRSFTDSPGPTRFFVGISNTPRSIEPAILNQISPLYFECASEEQALKILQNEGVKEPDRVVATYCRLCRESGNIYTGRSVGKGMEQIRLFWGDDWLRLGPDALAEELYAQGRLLPADAVAEYERHNSWIIETARSLAQSLQPRFAQLARQATVPAALLSAELAAEIQSNERGVS